CARYGMHCRLTSWKSRLIAGDAKCTWGRNAQPPGATEPPLFEARNARSFAAAHKAFSLRMWRRSQLVGGEAAEQAVACFRQLQTWLPHWPGQRCAISGNSAI